MSCSFIKGYQAPIELASTGLIKGDVGNGHREVSGH